MNTRNNYIKPEVEIITLEIEESIMALSVVDNEKVDVSRSKRRNFWDDDKE